VEKLEKLASKAASTIQANRLTFKVGNCFLHILLKKTLYSLFENDRG
jgi:hypothetical protein